MSDAGQLNTNAPTLVTHFALVDNKEDGTCARPFEPPPPPPWKCKHTWLMLFFFPCENKGKPIPRQFSLGLRLLSPHLSPITFYLYPPSPPPPPTPSSAPARCLSSAQPSLEQLAQSLHSSAPLLSYLFLPTLLFASRSLLARVAGVPPANVCKWERATGFIWRANENQTGKRLSGACLGEMLQWGKKTQKPPDAARLQRKGSALFAFAHVLILLCTVH